MTFPIIELMETSDGSHTLYRPDLNETYHSQHGALQESRYVFIERGLKPTMQRGLPGIRLMEVGLGTGLNILLTALEVARVPNLFIDAISLEPFPIGSVLAKQLNYPAWLPQHANAGFLLEAIHRSPWEEETSLARGFHCARFRRPWKISSQRSWL